MSMRSQKMATLSVNAMEMTRHPYDTIDKASVQNFYDEIRPRVLVPTSSEQPSQGSKVTSAGGECAMADVVTAMVGVVTVMVGVVTVMVGVVTVMVGVVTVMVGVVIACSANGGLHLR